MQLNQRQRRFCEEYAVSGNGTQSAIRAGYSKKNARNSASILLTKSNVIKYVKELQKPREDEIKDYLQIINDAKPQAAKKLEEHINHINPAISIRACEDILQLEKTNGTSPKQPRVLKVEFV